MNKFLFLALLLFALPGFSEVYKWTDEEGNVHYGDNPSDKVKSEKVDLPDYSRYTPRSIEQKTPAEAEKTPADAEKAINYKSFLIINPEPGGTVRSNEGQVSVRFFLEPALQAGHKIGVMIDGVWILKDLVGSGATINGIERGSHQMAAAVFDAAGKEVIRAPTVSFTLRKRGLFDQAENNASSAAVPAPRVGSAPNYTAPANSNPYRPSFDAR